MSMPESYSMNSSKLNLNNGPLNWVANLYKLCLVKVVNTLKVKTIKNDRVIDLNFTASSGRRLKVLSVEEYPKL